MIRVKGLRKAFPAGGRRIEVVRGVDLSVPEGTFFTMLGPSGCGKTTTLRSIAGLDVPDDGIVEIHDAVVSDGASGTFVPAARRQIGMVFQSYAVWPHMSVIQNVLYPLKARRFPRRETNRIALEALARVGLQGMAHRPTPELSGGQQQRVALARALVGNPRALLLDEPLSNLDANLRAQMRRELKELQSSLGITTVYVTHDQEEALSMSDRIAVMAGGVVMEEGTPAEIYGRPRTSFTASFVGAANLLPVLGLDAGPERGVVTARTAIGRLLVSRSVDLVGDGPFDVCIRPEKVRLLRSDESRRPGEDGNVVRARVAGWNFLGHCLDGELRVGEHVLRARTTGGTVGDVGSEVAVHLPPGDCRLVTREGP